MMEMPWVLVTLMIFLLLVSGGVYVGIRVLGSRHVQSDHPTKDSGSRP